MFNKFIRWLNNQDERDREKEIDDYWVKRERELRIVEEEMAERIKKLKEENIKNALRNMLG